MDMAIHDTIAMWQERILSKLTSSLTPERLYDSELRVPADEMPLRHQELLKSLTSSIFSEVDKEKKDGEFS